MKRLTMRAMRGGLGATSLLADLALALHEQGERVLLVDLSPDNMLRLHFNVDIGLESGWARAAGRKCVARNRVGDSPGLTPAAVRATERC